MRYSFLSLFFFLTPALMIQLEWSRQENRLSLYLYIRPEQSLNEYSEQVLHGVLRPQYLFVSYVA